MRARGAKVTDIVILVVAADDGVMPQTIEAINHAKAAGVPIIVAVNKIDKDGANPEQVKQMLTEHEIVPEEWGGKTIFVDVSAKKRIEPSTTLLEMILLQADVLELKANPDTPRQRRRHRSQPRQGPRSGRDRARAARHAARWATPSSRARATAASRAMSDDRRRAASTRPVPPTPVEILGSRRRAVRRRRVPRGRRRARARRSAEERATQAAPAARTSARATSTLDDLFSRIQQGEIKDLNLIVKADVQGSIEALNDALDKMPQDEVRINVIHSGCRRDHRERRHARDRVGRDHHRLQRAPAARGTRARRAGEGGHPAVPRDLRGDRGDQGRPRGHARSRLSRSRIRRTAEVRDLFQVPKLGTIAGCFVQEGKIYRDDAGAHRARRHDRSTTASSTRSGASRTTSKRSSRATSAASGIENFQDIKEGDVIETYKTVEVAREE